MLLRCLFTSASGSISIATAVLLPVLFGFVALGVDVGFIYTTKRSMQGAADMAVMSAATARLAAGTVSGAGSAAVAEGKGVAAASGWTDGVSGVSVHINLPPVYGSHAGDSHYIEAVIQQTDPQFFSSFLGSAATPLVHSVASLGSSGNNGGGGTGACIIGLAAVPGNTLTTSGNGNLTLGTPGNASDQCEIIGAGNITDGTQVTAYTADIKGTISNPSKFIAIVAPTAPDSTLTVSDPYTVRSAPRPSGCDHSSLVTVSTTTTIQPGTYCGGLAISGNNKTITLAQGIYYIEGPNGLAISSGSIVCGVTSATVTTACPASGAGSGVTFVLTGTAASPTSVGSVSITGQASVYLTAPSTGITAGLIFFQDRVNAPAGTNSFAGGGTMHFTGAMDFPKQIVSLSGGGTWSSPCTQIIAQTVTVTGTGNLHNSCAGVGILPAGGGGSGSGTTPSLVE